MNAQRNLTTEAVEIPNRTMAVNPAQLEFLRLPRVGERCPVTGFSRGALNQLILPCEANDFHPPVRSFCLRQRGAKTGIRLIDYQSLRDFIFQHAENGNAVNQA
jgi:hypothetical protein